MTFSVPDYFGGFKCLAGGCPESCCLSGWEIPIDPDTYSFYLSRVDDISENTLQNSDGERVFLLDGSRCRYLDGSGLCRLYSETGRQCEICEKYPRFYEEFDGFSEAGLSLSCVEAARLVLERDGFPYNDISHKTGDPLLEFLLSARSAAMKMILECNFADDAAEKLCGYADGLQQLIDYDRLDLLGEVEAFSPDILTPERDLAFRKTILEKTEPLSPKWFEALRLLPENSGSEKERKNYLLYLVYRRFLKAINTEDIFSECLYIALLYRLCRTLGKNFCASASMISKEIEHCPENVEALLASLSG